jgi:hypothetical protein
MNVKKSDKKLRRDERQVREVHLDLDPQPQPQPQPHPQPQPQPQPQLRHLE